MLNTRSLLRIGVFFCVALFVVGIIRLFWLRFEAGDIYPPYSSLRSDPQGTQVLYESLRELGGQEISRNFTDLGQVAPRPVTTFVVCGLTHMPSTAVDIWKTLLEKVTAGGGRLVISLSATSRIRAEEKDDMEDSDDADGDTEEETSPESPPLGLKLRRRALGETQPDQAVWQNLQENDTLPEAITFRSPLFFELNDPAWETIYSFENEPVIVRRAWGDGEVVLIADSYLLSNEAMRNHRYPELLAWMIRPDGPVVFDEYHHGLTRQPGISTLMRKYRLHGVLLSLVVVVALLIWQRAVVFAPRPADDNNRGEAEDGTDATGGWVGLMRRHITPGNLLGVCLEAWESSTAADRFSKEQVGQVRNIIRRQGESQQRRNPVAVYQSICELLKQGKTP